MSAPRPPAAAAGSLVGFPLTPEQAAVQRIARETADGVFRGRAARWDEREEYPWDNVKDLVATGLMGMTIPREHGGRGARVLDAILAIEAVARACGVTGRLLVDSNFGAGGAIVHYGTETQKRDFLPLVVHGDKPAIAITEPGAGSAAADLVTTAVADGETWRLDGVKHWITGAGVSRTYVVFCRFDGIRGAPGIGAVVVPADAPGLTVRRRERAMGMRGIPEGLADMAIDVEAARQLIYRTADNAGACLPDQHAASACKVVASEMAVRVTNQALQVFGARGYSRDCPVERMVRDARMFTIAGGTVQMLRNLVANCLLGRADQPEERG